MIHKVDLLFYIIIHVNKTHFLHLLISSHFGYFPRFIDHRLINHQLMDKQDRMMPQNRSR